MRLAKALFLAVTIVAMAAGPTQAANWTGCHAGAHGGINALTLEPYGLGGDGTAIGVNAGCDYQIDRMVVGASGDYDWSRVDVGLSATSLDVSAVSIGARAGVLLGLERNTLAYGLIGYRNAVNDEIDVEGISFGGGLETALVRNRGGFLSLKIEGRHTNYGAVGELEPAETAITGGLAYHFGGQPVAIADEPPAPAPVLRQPIK